MKNILLSKGNKLLKHQDYAKHFGTIFSLKNLLKQLLFILVCTLNLTELPRKKRYEKDHVDFHHDDVGDTFADH